MVIHTVPRQARAESIFDRVRAVAARNNVSVHELSVQSHQGRLRVEQHLELDETLPLLEAHDFVCALEAEILREAPEIDGVLTHIESEPATIEQPEEMVEEDRRIEAGAASGGRADRRDCGCARDHGGPHGRAHPCFLPLHAARRSAMQQVHEVITALEDRFKLECPEVYRVTIHPEPVTDNLR